jgi:hypothetical protein
VLALLLQCSCEPTLREIPVLEGLRNADLDKLTPLEALNLLAALQKQLS